MSQGPHRGTGEEMGKKEKTTPRIRQGNPFHNPYQGKDKATRTTTHTKEKTRQPVPRPMQPIPDDGSCILHLSDLILGKPTGTVFEGCVPVCLVCPSLSVCRAGEHI